MRFAAVLLALSFVTPAALAAWPPPFPADRSAVRELRVGVVCYGGVSLAIYMYGMTRELHNLVIGSAALDCDASGDKASCGDVRPGEAWKSLPPGARSYYAALVDLWRTERVRTRVVVDVISGTSAGGINGIVLAKALAHNRSLVGLRRIWFEEADIGRLAPGKPWALRAGFRLIRGKPALEGDAWLKALYDALNAMDDPANAPRLALRSLIPPEQSLDLLVTATDFFGSDRLLEIGDPATSWEPRHDQVFRFSVARAADGSVDGKDFNRPNNPGLAFAARSSASFPVAFPAIRLDDLPRALGEPIDTATLARRLFADRLEGTKDRNAPARLAKNLYLVDGGVLDNYPFSIAYQRVSRRSPVLETKRVFIYLEPDPRLPRAAASAAAAAAEPSAVEMFWNAKTSIPGAEPIATDLLEIARHNQRVDRIVEILREDEKVAREELRPPRPAQHSAGRPAAPPAEPSIARRIERTLGIGENALAKPALLSGGLMKRLAPAGVASPPEGGAAAPLTVERRRTLEELQGMRKHLEASAAGGLPIMEEAYLRLRVYSVLEQFARVMASSICELPDDFDGPRSSLTRAIVLAWATKRQLIGPSINRERRDDFLRAFDLGYLRRNLRFVSDWLNAQYDPGLYCEHDYGLTREQIHAARAAVARHVGSISEVLRGNRLEALGVGNEKERASRAICVSVDPALTPAAQAATLLKDQTRFDAIAALEVALEDVLLDFQKGVLADLYGDFVQQTSTWNHPEAARAVLARYLGFAYWDRVSYPYTAFSGVGDLARVHIIRFSPNDTTSISRNGAAKLSGKDLAHFGAFFDRNGRERDYLWGRLDAAERALVLLRMSGDRARLGAMLDAILKEEETEGEVSEKNLRFMRQCVARPGSC